MKIVGTIVEYNPLHNGHLYAIEEIKRQSQADCLIAVMSGEFSMRGDLCLFDKFTKTKQALLSGIDLVIELPFLYTVQYATIFAAEAVRQLYLAGASEIWIGSESNRIEQYETASQLWKQNQSLLQQKIHEGFSFKEATSFLGLEANDMLGFCYFQAIKENQYPIALHTILRKGSGYHDLTVKEFASAKAIRKNLHLMADYCPSYVHAESIRNQEKLLPFIKYELIHHSLEELKAIFFVEEGLEHALKKAVSQPSWNEFVSSLVSKRYTQSRIQRMLIYVLLHINKETMTTLRDLPRNYIRILGYTKAGLNHLKTIKKSITILTNIKEGLHPVLDYDFLISKILDTIYQTNLVALEQKGPITI